MNQANSSGQSSLSKWILSVIAVAVLVVSVVVVWQRGRDVNTSTNTNALNTSVTNGNTPPNTNQATNRNESLNANVDMTDWKTLRSDQLNFSVRYPTRWLVQTVGADGGLNRRPFDVVLSEDTCAPGVQCNISSGYCRVAIGTLDYPLTAETDTEKVLTDLRTKAKTAIATVFFPTYTAYKTKVSATPPDAQDEQSLGAYYLLSLKERFLRAYLDSGYLREECDTVLAQILSSLTQ
ncbi:MAG: hypothetical protein HY340_02435 [Candidatus Kerfeldbacteria bacterium]|nr:hypothetical protein [Candidatus Kerfeldbacteria bacterium]